MPSLLLVVFILQFLLHIINTVGATTVDELLWILYNKFPTPTSSSARKAQSLKKEVVRLKRELGAVSAQDDFARWAKLQRQHDKAMADFQKSDNSIRTHRQTFTSAVSTLRWLGTQGLRFVLQFWFSKSPMFWIPQDWVPYYVEWLLSFPRAPLGSVSINIWGIACASMIALVGEALTATYVLATRKPLPVGEKAGQPMAFEAKPQQAQEPKKEL
ncbi:CHD5-domain-containing protein [Aaosphaeria arxii CBS 175.79]|uniref:CHD5-domain-containing protein n=1 Tax=Aaosphaeria arxii CBS 175.79 TaxID=1450172 RepID=A0A6A5XM05_9PLEO|nr:CHD5-domain-containing protein [Aaosphaeria arxii CBS 175.79]KAF2013867.1 CHD5-domain-containing protein [Aaosphaeria arxii CBS 175.79]